jgi:hypothetical protein
MTNLQLTVTKKIEVSRVENGFVITFSEPGSADFTRVYITQSMMMAEIQSFIEREPVAPPAEDARPPLHIVERAPWLTPPDLAHISHPSQVKQHD